MKILICPSPSNLSPLTCPSPSVAEGHNIYSKLHPLRYLLYTLPRLFRQQVQPATVSFHHQHPTTTVVDNKQIKVLNISQYLKVHRKKKHKITNLLSIFFNLYHSFYFPIEIVKKIW